MRREISRLPRKEVFDFYRILNAVAESWFATLKPGVRRPPVVASQAQLRRALYEFIQVFYNRKWIQSSLNYLSPADYEHQIHHSKAPQAE